MTMSKRFSLTKYAIYDSIEVVEELTVIEHLIGS